MNVHIWIITMITFKNRWFLIGFIIINVECNPCDLHQHQKRAKQIWIWTNVKNCNWWCCKDWNVILIVKWILNIFIWESLFVHSIGYAIMQFFSKETPAIRKWGIFLIQPMIFWSQVEERRQQQEIWDELMGNRFSSI